jgi:hypothetical protein
MGIDADGRYRPVRQGAPAPPPAPPAAVRAGFNLAAHLEALRAEAPKESPRPVAQGDKIQVEVVKIDGRDYHLRPIEGGPEIVHPGRGVGWRVSQIVKVKVLEVKRDGRITKVAPA